MLCLTALNPSICDPALRILHCVKVPKTYRVCPVVTSCNKNIAKSESKIRKLEMEIGQMEQELWR